MKNRSSGFTLIELLVVIAVIAVLAALLFPTFAKAREKGRQTTCINNLKQLSQVIQMYVQVNNGRYPGPSWIYGPGEVLKKEGQTTLSMQMKYSPILWCPSGVQPFSGPSGTLSLAVCTNGHYPIPPPRSAGACSYMDTNYVYNTQLLLDPFAKGNSSKEEAELTVEILFILTDGETENRRSIGIPRTDCPEKVNGKSYPTLHQKGGNYLFANSQAKWMLPETAAAIDCSAARDLFLSR